MKKLLALILTLGIIFSLTGCNYQMIDTKLTYDRAIIELANGEVIEVKVKQWKDYDGEQLQIITEDGTVYLTSSFRCDLIRD